MPRDLVGCLDYYQRPLGHPESCWAAPPSIPVTVLCSTQSWCCPLQFLSRHWLPCLQPSSQEPSQSQNSKPSASQPTPSSPNPSHSTPISLHQRALERSATRARQSLQASHSECPCMAWHPEHVLLSHLNEMSTAACRPACDKPPSPESNALVASKLRRTPELTSDKMPLQSPEAGCVDVQQALVAIQGVTPLTLVDGRTCWPVQS